MDRKWSFEDAREQLAELVRRARERGPQVLTDHGEDSAVVLSCEEYSRLRGAADAADDEPGSALSLLRLFQDSPLRGVDLDLERGRESAPEPVDLSE